MARVFKQEEPTPEDSEAIAGIEAFSLDEIKKGFQLGYLVYVNKEGVRENVALRDPFLAFALLQAEIRGLISSDKKN